MTLLTIVHEPALYGVPSSDQLPPASVAAAQSAPTSGHAVKLQILNVFEASGVAPFSPGCPTTVSVEANFMENELPLSFLRRVACFVKDTDQFSDELGHAILRLLYVGAFNLSFDLASGYRRDTLPLQGKEIPSNRMAVVRIRPPHTIYVHGSSFTAAVAANAGVSPQVTAAVSQTTIRMDQVRNGATSVDDVVNKFVDSVPEVAKTCVKDLFRRGLCYLPVEEDVAPCDPRFLQCTTPNKDVVLQFAPSDNDGIVGRVGTTIKSFFRAIEAMRVRGKLANGLKLSDDVMNLLKKHFTLLPQWEDRLLTLRSHLFLDGKQYALAAAALSQTLPRCLKQEKLSRTKQVGIWLNDARDYSGAYQAFNSYLAINSSLPAGEGASQELITEVKLRLSGSMYMAGQLSEQQAIEMVQNTLKGDMTNDVGIALMVRFYTGRKLASDALSWAVQLLIRNHSSPEAWRYNELAGWVMRSFGSVVTLQTLTQLLPTGKGGTDMASAIGHLALIAKDNGLIDIAIGLYEWCCDMSPIPSLLLNLAHCYETANNPLQSLKTLQNAFLGPLKQTTVGGVSCFELGKLMGDLKNVDGRYPVPKDVCLKRLNKRHRCLRVVSGTNDVLTFATAEEVQTIPPAAFVKTPYNQAGTVTYTETELFILGMFFTVCKDFYVLGLFDKLVDVIPMIAPVRANASLHLTLIRNESAYFSTVTLLMQYHDSRLNNSPAASFDEMVYVVGDSHTFAPAWQIANFHQKRVLLNTTIVTGLKIWHLREESEFFPKKTFELVLSKIPAKSHVLIVVGEIDCREGVPRTVDRGVYPTTERAIEVLCDLYAKVLLQVRSKYDFGNIYVHAPPAGLELTRTIVMQMHEQMRKALLPLASEKIFFVNPEILQRDRVFVQSATSGSPDEAVEKWNVKSAYVLDGMHLAPTYVTAALTPAMEQAEEVKVLEPVEEEEEEEDLPPPAEAA